jgi:hypothetical protein
MVLQNWISKVYYIFKKELNIIIIFNYCFYFIDVLQIVGLSNDYLLLFIS